MEQVEGVIVVFIVTVAVILAVLVTAAVPVAVTVKNSCHVILRLQLES